MCIPDSPSRRQGTDPVGAAEEAAEAPSRRRTAQRRPELRTESGRPTAQEEDPAQSVPRPARVSYSSFFFHIYDLRGRDMDTHTV